MTLILQAAFGAAVVVIIQLLSQTRNFYIAGLAPLFPTFALIAHYIVGTGRSTRDLKETILFGIFAIIPYGVYLVALYFLVDRMKLVPALITAAGCWSITALILIVVWNKI